MNSQQYMILHENWLMESCPFGENDSNNNISANGWLVGVGPGAGIGLMFAFTCTVCTQVCLVGYLYAPLRNLED